MPLSRSDIKAYLYVLNEPAIMYSLPIVPPENLVGCARRIRDQLERFVEERPKGNYWRCLLEKINEREQLNGVSEPNDETKAELAEKTRLLALQLYSLYTQKHQCYRKVLILNDGARHNLSPVTALEFQMFHGGSFEVFKKDFGYKSLEDFTPEQLAGAEVALYSADGQRLSWSCWNCCVSFGEEAERVIAEWDGRRDGDIVD